MIPGQEIISAKTMVWLFVFGINAKLFSLSISLLLVSYLFLRPSALRLRDDTVPYPAGLAGLSVQVFVLWLLSLSFHFPSDVLSSSMSS